MVAGIWRRKGMPKTINKEITKAFGQHLYSGVEKGYGKTLIGLDYDTPDYNMLLNLRNNVYQFAGAKNYQQLKDITQALIGEDGKLRTLRQFKAAAAEINQKYVGPWQEAEYNLAVAGSQMASKWVDIQAQGPDTMLEFDAVIDQRTTDLCRSLHLTRKPASDPFWQRNYPPNHWGERSTVRIVYGMQETKTEDIVIPDKLPAMFQVNLGQRGLVFPPGHPYWDGTPEDVLKDALNINSKP